MNFVFGRRGRTYSQALQIRMKSLLIVDDREDDRYLLERALRKLRVRNSVLSFPDGQALTQYLEGPGTYINRHNYPCPTVLFLDLDMPRMDGMQTLQWLNKHRRMEEFFVVAVTVLRHQQTIKSAYALGARSYLSKPLQEEELRNLLEHYPALWDRDKDPQERSRAIE
jgi:CheY-like chemotaxis protein